MKNFTQPLPLPLPLPLPRHSPQPSLHGAASCTQEEELNSLRAEDAQRTAGLSQGTLATNGIPVANDSAPMMCVALAMVASPSVRQHMHALRPMHPYCLLAFSAYSFL